ncbi:MAG TPA: ABC transporter permease, partial [Longimicrobiaceae bacterium]|nr:ABC transporter permease [Longimicrobiaceae bacterium]
MHTTAASTRVPDPPESASNAVHPRRRAPTLTASIVLTLAIGIGLGVPVLAATRAGLGRVLPCLDSLVCEANPSLDWLPRWTAHRRVVAQIQGESLRTLLWVVLALALLLLAGALVNVLTTLLVRAAVRRPEIAMRAALGARGWRLVRQLLVEGVLLVVPGAALGLATAVGGAGVLDRSWPFARTPWAALPVDGHVLAIVIGTLAGVALLAWLSPVGVAWRRDLRRHLATGGRATAGRGEVALRNSLVILQISASLVVLACAGLLIRGFASSPGPRQGPGFDARNVLTVQVRLPDGGRADVAARAGFYEEAIRRIRALPGVVDTGTATIGAWVGLGTTDQVRDVCIECHIGLLPRPLNVGPARIHAVSPGYFRALGVPVLEGREFAEADRAGATRVAVIGRNFAYRLFPQGEPLGKPIQVGGKGGEWYRVVGVVDDVHAQGIGAEATAEPALYLSILQHPPRSAAVAVRTTADPMRIAPAVASAVKAIEPRVALTNTMTMDQYL